MRNIFFSFQYIIVSRTLIFVLVQASRLNRGGGKNNHEIEFYMELEGIGLEEFEPVMRELYQTAFFTENSCIIAPNRSAYIRACNNDYHKAQNGIASKVFELYDRKKTNEAELKKNRQLSAPDKERIGQLLTQNEIIDRRIIVLRRLYDGIAFRIFDNKIWIAKRFVERNGICSPNIPAIKENLEAANHFNNDNGLDFAIVPDLTTFINIGDLIIKRDKGPQKWQIVELKTGKINLELFSLFEKNQTEREQAEAGFDKTTASQWHRILQQKDRSGRIVEFVRNNGGTDTITGIPVKLLDQSPTYYCCRELQDMVRSAQQNQISLCTLDDCFTIFASTLPETETQYYFYRYILSRKLESESEPVKTTNGNRPRKTKKMPSYCFYKDLVWNNMGAKWHTPIFVLGLGNNLFDLLFARMRVLLHLDLSRFLRLCNKSGLKTEPSTRAETNLFLSKFREMPLLNGRTIKAAGPNGKNAVISQELLNKIFYDLISPQMVINRLREIVEVC